jgi:hypothetical protein
MRFLFQSAWLIFLILQGTVAGAQQRTYKLTSPDKSVVITFELNHLGNTFYSISKNNQAVLQRSKLGLMREDGDFTNKLKFASASKITVVTDKYEILTAKRRLNTYRANKQVFHLLNAAGQQLDIIFQLSNEGVAFRYYFPEKSADVKRITQEKTSYKFSIDTKAWLQPMSDAQTGWEHSNPSYEEFYEQGIPVGKPSPIKAGWVFPALFQTGQN